MIYKLPILLILLILVFPGSVYAGTATLSFSPSTFTFNKGCSYTLDVNLDTGAHQTDGTDAIIKYDPAAFNVTNIKQGTIYSDYPGNNIDATSGKITISGLASVSSPFTGKGTLATLNFSIKDNAQTGATQITFDFDPNNKTKTSDSNVVERGTVSEVLNSVVNGSYTIGTGSCTGTAAATPIPTQPPISYLPGTGQGQVYYYPTATPTAVYKPLPPELPKGGTAELTATIVIVGTALTILGILGLALL